MPLKKIIPFIFLFALILLLGRELRYFTPEIPSNLIGEALPAFNLPNLYPTEKNFTQNDLKKHLSLLNVWSTWCSACILEHSMLMKIKQNYHIPIYSIVYKDDPKEAARWLQKNGNPFELSGNDNNGEVAIDFGVYGTPETFVISKEGKIIYRYIGMIDQKNWDETLYPIIKRYGAMH